MQSELSRGPETEAFELEPFGDLGDFDYEEEGFEEVEDGFDETHEVIIPDGLKEGDAFIAVVGDEEFRVTVPAGFKPGDSLLLDVDPPSDPSDFPSDSKEAPRGLPSSDSKDQDSKAHSKPAKLKPKRQVSFTEQEPSVMLFSPNLGGLSLDAESPPDFGAADFLDLIIPDHASAGDVLEVQSDSGQTIEVVVPDGAEAGMTLTVMSPTGKHAGFEELSFTDQSPQEEQDESLHKRSQQAEQIEVVIPDHASAGDVLEVQSESGQTIEVVVPEGAEAGMTLTVESPASKDGKMDKFPDNPAFVAEAPENAHDESLDTQNQKTERINIIVAHGDACAETVLEVESHSGNKDEAVVPDGAEARVTLTVESPTNKDGKMDRFPDDPAFVAESPEKAHDESLEQTERINIVVPDDASAGDVLEVESDSGTKIEVVVPEGIEAGTTVTVESPTNKDGKMERFPDDPAFVAESPEKAHDGSLEQTERINIVVPDDASAGDVLEVESDSGTKIEVVVPEGIEAGMTVTVESPTNKDGKMERFPDNPAFVAESPEKAHDESLEQTERINIVVPDDASAGDVLEVESDSGNKIEVVVPEGIEAGMTLTVESPTNKDGKMERFPDDPAFVAEQLHEHQVEEEGPTAALDRDCMALGGTYEAGGEQKQGAETAMTQSSKGVSQETDSTVKDSSSSSLSQGADTARHQRCETSGDTPGTPSFLELKASQSERPPPRCASSVPQVQANSIATQPRRVPEESTHRLSENQRRATATANSPNTARQPAKPTHVPFSEVPTKGSIPLKEGETGKGPDGMEMRRWLTSESGQIDLERRGAGRSSTKTKVDVSVQTETLTGQGLGSYTEARLPSCSLHRETRDVSQTAMKLALETLQQEKEDLQQKLRASQKEVLRLELRDEDEIKAMEANQNVLLRRENDELRKIALAALRQNPQAQRKRTSSNKMQRTSLGLSEAQESKWLQPPVKSKAKLDQVAMDDLEMEQLPADSLFKAAVCAPAGHAGGSHGLRRIRSQSDSCIATFEAHRGQIYKRKIAEAGRGEAGPQVLASPCGSAKAKVTSATPSVVRLKPSGKANRYAPDPGSCRSSESRSTWRGPNLPSELNDTPGKLETRWATASVYTAAAVNADSNGWGATATAAEAVATKWREKEVGLPDDSSPQNATIQPLIDDVKVANMNERAANGAFVLEPGQQVPELQCVDEIESVATASSESLAKEDNELREFFTCGAFASGSRLDHCCPVYRLIDDGSMSGLGDAVPLYRHTISDCLLLGFPVSLLAPQTSLEDIRLFFCRGPLPVMRRFGQGALGCMEILLELFGDADSIGGKQKGEFYVLSEGPGYGNCESSGSTGSLCYLPILVARQYSRSCTAPSCERVDKRRTQARCFIKLPDIAQFAGFAFDTVETRLKAEMYHSDQQGKAVRLLANFLSSIGRVQEAVQHWQQALKEDEARLGSSHLQTAQSAAALASCFDDLGRAEEAEVFHSKALDALAKSFGRSSCEATACELALAACRFVQGKSKLHGMLPATQSGVLCLQGAAAQAVAVIFGQAVGDEKDAAEAEPLYRQALCILRRALGPNHPDTLHCLNNLALCLAEQDKLSQAEQLLRRTVAGMEVVLAPTHPRPIQALSNLACCLAEQGQTGEAESCHRRAFENCKRRLGWQHPETSACAQSLAHFLASCGRCTEAALLELQADQLGRRRCTSSFPHQVHQASKMFAD